jgi:hypothetical protein
MTGLGIALLPQIINGEAQIAVYLAGLVQQVLLTLIIFSPVIRWKRQPPPLKVSLLPPNRTQGVTYMKPSLVESLPSKA